MIEFSNVTQTDVPKFRSLRRAIYEVCPEEEMFEADSAYLFIDNPSFVESRMYMPYNEYLKTSY